MFTDSIEIKGSLQPLILLYHFAKVYHFTTKNAMYPKYFPFKIALLQSMDISPEQLSYRLCIHVVTAIKYMMKGYVSGEIFVLLIKLALNVTNWFSSNIMHSNILLYSYIVIWDKMHKPLKPLNTLRTSEVAFTMEVNQRSDKPHWISMPINLNSTIVVKAASCVESVFNCLKLIKKSQKVLKGLIWTYFRAWKRGQYRHVKF